MAKTRENPAPLLQATGLTKRFGNFVANDNVSVSIAGGSIHALLGENGAGKSTFVKMLYGALAPDQGQLVWQGKPCQITSPKIARQLGIAMVFQHFSLFPALTVAENIALALSGDLAPASLAERITRAADHWGLEIDPWQPVAELSVGESQRVEILRCLLQDPKLLIMDEPTSVLTPQEAEKLFTVLRRLAAEGCAILYISHKLEEIMALAERATILRGGKLVADLIPAKTTTRAMAETMVGRSVDWIERQDRQNTAKQQTAETAGTDTVLEISHLSRPRDTAFGTSLDDICFNLKRGEILGIAGIAGNGQEELMAALTGEWLCPAGTGLPQSAETPIKTNPGTAVATISLEGIALDRAGPSMRRSLGMELVPEERNGHATVPDMRLSENTFLTRWGNTPDRPEMKPTGWLKLQLRHAGESLDESRRIIAEHDVRIPCEDPLANQLSGGNLQKFIMGRSLNAAPKVAIIAQPTWGVDVGAATAIRRSLLQLADAGTAILLISQDLEEIFSLSDRIAVLNQGRLSPPQPTAEVDAEKVGLLMGGVEDETAAAAAANQAIEGAT